MVQRIRVKRVAHAFWPEILKEKDISMDVWDNNIKVDLQATSLEVMVWIHGDAHIVSQSS
jgi:hypothetical protein